MARLLGDHRGTLFGDHDRRRIGVGRADGRHHRGVDHAQPVPRPGYTFPLPTAENAILRPGELLSSAEYAMSINMLARICGGCRQPNLGTLKPPWQPNGSGIQQHDFSHIALS